MTVSLVLTNDWELFGDGSGDYWELQDRPLRAMLDIADAHDARFTVMAEIGQQWAHKRHAHLPHLAKVAEAWEAVLTESVRRGHDVQLHFHSQWIGARLDGGKWRLNDANVAIAALGSEAMTNLLKQGKTYLEEMLRPAALDYECIAYRAGAHCVEPSSVYLAALRHNGFRADSSVVKGIQLPGFFDFRRAPSNLAPWFPDAQDIQRHASLPSELAEFPVHTFHARLSALFRRLLSPKLYYRLSFGAAVDEVELAWQRDKQAALARRYPVPQRIAATGYGRKRGAFELLRRLVAREWIPLDCDNLPPSVFLNALESIVKMRRDLPVIAIGHSKMMHNCDNFARIVGGVKARFGSDITFSTLRQAVKAWMS